MDKENTKQFKHTELKLYDPKWSSDLATTIIELEKLRVKRLGGPVPPHVFFQLKEIFQLFESLGSARIEGNRTTLMEFVEKVIENPSRATADESMKEIFNLEDVIDFIEKNIKKTTIFDRALISEIHRIIVKDLTPPPGGEGSHYPGALRPVDVSITGSPHVPPKSIKVPEYFEELMTFVNASVSSKYHLLITALAHHRMAWIHPFDNGNGRFVRMFTYALLIKQGFQVKTGRILNPTAIFCMDRAKYYEMLAVADTGDEVKVLEWCEYVLNGLRKEIEKIDKLLNLEYITDTILIPALRYSLERKSINNQEHAVLSCVVKTKDMTIKSLDIKAALNEASPVQRSRIIKRLKDKEMLVPTKGNKSRKYTIQFRNNYLLRDVVRALEENGFVPEFLNRKSEDGV